MHIYSRYFVSKEVKQNEKKFITATLTIGTGLIANPTADPITWNTTTFSAFTCISGYGNFYVFTKFGINLSARSYATSNNSVAVN
jgi:hypothetical protein